jgi:5-methylcytosine-specific restriction protein A
MACSGCKKRRPQAGALVRQAKRWLATNDPRWRRIRARQLAREPLCRHCKQKGITTAATVVDHVDGHAATPQDYRDANLQSLCDPCHGVKTAVENGSFGRKDAKQAGCDDKGNPLDRTHPWNS